MALQSRGDRREGIVGDGRAVVTIHQHCRRTPRARPLSSSGTATAAGLAATLETGGSLLTPLLPSPRICLYTNITGSLLPRLCGGEGLGMRGPAARESQNVGNLSYSEFLTPDPSCLPYWPERRQKRRRCDFKDTNAPERRMRWPSTGPTQRGLRTANSCTLLTSPRRRSS